MSQLRFLLTSLLVLGLLDCKGTSPRIYRNSEIQAVKMMRNYLFGFCAWLLLSATCAEGQKKQVIIKEYAFDRCVDQDSLFREQLVDLSYQWKDSELLLEGTFLTACCQTLDLSLEGEGDLPTVALHFKKSGDMCDCYCLYPFQATLEIMDFTSYKALELVINKKPVREILTGN